eukprot:6374384-Pyramimonas_sp.AAC.1
MDAVSRRGHLHMSKADGDYVGGGREKMRNGSEERRMRFRYLVLSRTIGRPMGPKAQIVEMSEPM